MAKHEPHHNRLPGDLLPTYEELLQRIEKLEADKILLKDLPITELQNKMEQDWQPAANVLLPPRSVTADLLAQRSLGGAVDSAAATTQGTGFATTKPSTGVYVVAFSTAFASTPFVELTPLTGGARIADVTARATTGFTVTWRSDASAVADTAFMFIAREI